MWELLDVMLVIFLAGWLLDQEPPARPGVLRLVRGDGASAEGDEAPAHKRVVTRLW